MDCEGDGHGLFEAAIPKFSCRDWGNHGKLQSV